MLKNVVEEVMRQRIVDLLKGYDCCKCDKCVEDMLAIALNNIPPQYVNSDVGMLYKKAGTLNTQSAMSMDVELLKAMNLVSSNPKHN